MATREATLSAPRGISALGPFVTKTATLAALVVLSLVSSVAIVLLGPIAIAIPVILGAAVLVALKPYRAIVPLLTVAAVFEPNAIDFTAPIGDALWLPPGGIKLPLTVNVFEILLLAVALSVGFRTARQRTHRLPAVLWTIPVVLIAGAAYGLMHGAPTNLVYHEMRGLLFGIVAFLVAWRMPAPNRDATFRWMLLASTALAVIVLARYLFYLRSGDSGVTSERAFAHEDAIFLAFGFVLGLVLLLRVESLPPRILLALHNAIVLAALLGSGRRAATLALVVGVVTVGWVTFPRRRLLVLAVSVPLAAVSVVYLATYWNHEYGAMAQPARAIRSQISPSERDQSSDQYRATELYNIEQTIRLSPLFGVGFGKPFAQFQPLPDLTSYWPLQSYSPHQNLLWLWLKMGVVGITAFLSVWVVAVRRCLLAARLHPPNSYPVIAVLAAAGLVMYLAYAKVDIVFLHARSAVGLAILLAVACRVSIPGRQSKADPKKPDVLVARSRGLHS